MDDKVKISFDNEYKIRVLDPKKFARSEELEKECSQFVEKISSFSDKISSLVEVLESHATRIDSQKLRVRNRTRNRFPPPFFVDLLCLALTVNFGTHRP